MNVVGTMFFKDNKLLIDKPRKRATYQMIGGRVEENEKPLNAAIRECHEELGDKAIFDESKLELVMDFDEIATSDPNLKIHFYLFNYTGKLEGKLSNAIVKEFPELEDLEVTPSGQEQNFKSEKYGFNNVKVNAIEAEEIIITPSVEEQIKEGIFNKVIVQPMENIQPHIDTQNELLYHQSELLSMAKMMLTQLGYMDPLEVINNE